MTNAIKPIASPPVAAMANANTYSDSNGLAALKQDPNSPQALRAVAQQVDALFLQMMLKSMRDASAEIGGQDSNELGMYQDMFDKQVSLTMSQHQGLGLGASIVSRMPGGNAGAAPVTAAPRSAAPSGAAPVAAAPAGMAQSAEDFVSQVLPTIEQAARQLGVSPVAMLAQAALETGWGQRMARTADGAPSLNLFGVKADAGWSGARATASTLEFRAGVATPQKATFRAYGSIQESVSDFANLLQSSPRYRSCVAAGADPQAYVAAIGGSGYATDPQYGNKLNEIMNSGKLRTALRNSARVL